MMFSRVSFVGVLAVLGVLAGCGGDPGASGPDLDPGLDLDPDLAPELDDLDPPDGPAPDPFLYRSDTYDPVHNRFLTADCVEREVRSFDLDTHQLTTVVDTWPWEGTWMCPVDLALAPDGDRLLAFVDRAFDGVDGGCTALELVDIDLATGAVTPRHTYYEHCADDHGPNVVYRAPLLDPAQQRVLFMEAKCDPNACYTGDLDALTLATADPSHLARFYDLDCSVWPDWETCMDHAVTELGRDAVFHPSTPHRNLLVLMSGDDRVLAIDMDTGRTAPVLTLDRTWGALTIDRFMAMTLDPLARRLFVAGRVGWVRSAVVAVDLDTGQQSLLHDGGPNADGEQLRCLPRSLSFDSQAGRLLLYEPVSTSGPCTGDVFAIDAVTGALDKLSP